jgi:ubiquitin-small subunit ribosomal protein S27Ae
MAEKKKKKETIGSKRWKMYATDSNSAKIKNKECPKCSTGYYMAEHKDRRTCGKCGYTEFKKA